MRTILAHSKIVPSLSLILASPLRSKSSKSIFNAQRVSEEIKKTRIDIVHGYAYYYDFASDNKLHYIIIQFDRLIKAMSLMWMGFSNEEIMEFFRL